MAKNSSRFYCKSCGHEELRWLGQCPGCREWNTLAEVKVTKDGGTKGSRGYSTKGKRPVGFGDGAGKTGTAAAWPEAVGPDGRLRPVPLAKITSADKQRLPVEPAEVANVVGGGLVEGSVVLLGGEPGVGKSTLLTGLALWWVRQGIRVIYVAGEESPAQIRMRAERLGFAPQSEDGFDILPEVHLETLLEALVAELAAEDGGQPCVIIADSVQTLHSGQIDAYPGSPTQIKYCGGVLADFARRTDSVLGYFDPRVRRRRGPSGQALQQDQQRRHREREAPFRTEHSQGWSQSGPAQCSQLPRPCAPHRFLYATSSAPHLATPGAPSPQPSQPPAFPYPPPPNQSQP